MRRVDRIADTFCTREQVKTCTLERHKHAAPAAAVEGEFVNLPRADLAGDVADCGGNQQDMGRDDDLRFDPFDGVREEDSPGPFCQGRARFVPKWRPPPSPLFA